MKIAVIGFGAASIGFLNTIKNTGHEVHIFESSKDIYSSSLSGIRSDGKLFVSASMGGDLPVDIKLQKEVVDFYINHSALGKNEIEYGYSFSNAELYKKFYDYGFDPIKSDFYHIGTDKLGDILTAIYSEFKMFNNMYFYFGRRVESIEPLQNGAQIQINGEKILFDLVVVAAGRSGHKLTSNFIHEHPEVVLSNTTVDLGVRYELADHIVQELNKEMYEFKVKLKTKTGYMVRTFCNNPSGEVVLEKYDDFVTVNGHAKMKEKTTNTNFAVLVTHSFTSPFNDPVGYGSYIAKLSNILAGNNKVILQAYGDFKQAKRTKKLGRVLPTLKSENYILGDLNLVFPRKTVESIIYFLEELNKVIPGITYEDNLLYGVEVKFYGNKLDNNKYKSIKFIGDCSGWTRSITYATSHGIMLGQELFL
ncbi:MAG TPA: NAD(P)/FAD-dependent oxidoreductase [Petrotogaceae bacterium]|nr:NAD(P)/FAD-dependent oxidoreductase [Petrotogaceae bacterium]